MSKILPYQLEPEYYSGEEDNAEVFSESEEEENDSSTISSTESRQTDSSWCSCRHCVVMEKEIECICSQEIAFLSRIVKGKSTTFAQI